jgi:hypothetical protein
MSKAGMMIGGLMLGSMRGLNGEQLLCVMDAIDAAPQAGCA